MGLARVDRGPQWVALLVDLLQPIEPCSMGLASVDRKPHWVDLLDGSTTASSILDGGGVLGGGALDGVLDGGVLN
jgi:hypothetical protein